MDDRPPPMPPREEPPKRTFWQWATGRYPLRCGCIIREGQTCPHGWMIRVIG